MNITFTFSDLNILVLYGSPFQPTKNFLMYYSI